MNTVFVVREVDWEEAPILGIFTTEELAKQFITDNKLEEHYKENSVQIEEYKLDDPICYADSRTLRGQSCKCGCKSEE